MFLSRSKQSGQIAVAVILAVAAVIVVAVSLASRTTQEQSLTTQTTESTVTFNAAEAGVEQALSSVLTSLESAAYVTPPPSGSVTLNNNTTVDYTITQSPTLDVSLAEGATAQVSLDGDRNGSGDYTGTIDILWGKDADCTKNASLIISLISNPSGSYRARYYAVGPYGGCADRSGDEFTAASAGIDGYKNRYQIAVSSAAASADLMLRIKTVYADSPILVRGLTSNLPTQQYIVRSTAVNTAGDKQETRVLEVKRSLPVAPNIMDYALYSGGNISK